jgi:hypothetical protein
MGNLGIPPRITGNGLAELVPGKRPGVRIMFATWLVLIGSGLVLYTIIGLSHH